MSVLNKNKSSGLHTDYSQAYDFEFHILTPGFSGIQYLLKEKGSQLRKDHWQVCSILRK